jgi:hypothetical protein
MNDSVPARAARRLLAPTLLLAVPAAALAQNDISWAEFVQDNSKLSGPASLGVNDQQEKDYAVADLNADGWDDLIVVRKQPFTTSGRYPNVLYMNENGALVNRTSQYASDSDVPGDNGFDTPTNDRDVVAVDVDNDGWIDVVTATTFSVGQPKHISHPRVYMNKGIDGQGNWLGLRYEDARIPQLTLGNGSNAIPFFCGVGAGDVTGDGFADLYFADYDVAGNPDVDDRLLINDGNGFFTDESLARMTTAMLDSPFGTAAEIVDLNGDGVNDVVKNSGLGQTTGNPRCDVSYNNPNNEGFFNILQTAVGGTPYHVASGDLNLDGKLDLVVSDDASDRYVLNQGNDGLGRVIWSSLYSFNTDDGFGSNITLADLNNDGWPEAIISDVDVDIPGCSRRVHIYHNRGGTVGGFIDMDEESGSGYRGVTGLTTASMTGMHDVAVLDIDNDGDNDMVFGRCTGTSVWINQLDPQTPTLGVRYCNPAVSNSTGGPAEIAASGTDVVFFNSFFLTATSLPTNQFGYFITAATQGLINNPGGSQGNLCLSGTFGRFVQQVQSSGGSGEFTIQVDLTALPAPLSQAVSAGETWNFTCWYRDFNPSSTSNFTDGVSVTFQ